MEELKSLLFTDTGLTWIGKILVSLFVVLAVWMITRAITSAVRRFVVKRQKGRHSQKTNTIISVLSKVITVVIAFWGLTYILELFGVNTQSMIATAGIGGIAIGFGAQSLVKDVITGGFLLMEDQFALGDYIKAAGAEGYVTNMNLRVTTVRAFSGEITHIPNGSITTVTNISREPMRALVEITVPYAIDAKKAHERVSEALVACAQEADFYTENPEVIGITGYTDFHYILTVVGHTKPMSQWTAERQMRAVAGKAIRELETEEETKHGAKTAL